MIAAETVVPKKLKIKFSSQRIEIPGIKACDSGHVASKNDSQDCDAQNIKQSSMVPGTKKRGPLNIIEGQPEKKWKMDCTAIEGQQEKKQKMHRTVIQQCSSLLRSLMSNPAGWAFKEPVDPVKLNIPDYFSIISNPMDLGTVKSKLGNNIYPGTEEFAADVRLTFSNAMLYNPPTNYVHKMAEKLNKIFEMRWKSLEEKWNREVSASCVGKFVSRKPKESTDTRQNCPETPPLCNAIITNRSKPYEDKTMRSSSVAGAAEVQLSKPAEKCRRKASEQVSCKGTDSSGKHAFGSGNVKLLLSPVRECGACGRSACHCSLPSDSAHASSDISSERSSGRDNHACTLDFLKSGKSLLTSQMSKSDPDSDGAVSALDEENICPSSQPTASATDATSGEVWRPPIFDVQLSPTKALRAARLKHRFAETILKAQHKTCLDNGDKADPVKLRQEKERLEKWQREEKALIEAHIREAEAASRKREEIELKKQREKEREAARLALQKMEKTAGIDQNLELLKELEMLGGGSLYYNVPFYGKDVEVAMGGIEGAYFRNPLERLGLFIKDDSVDEDEILNGDGEEGEIFP